jgi:NAD(P)H dehydrogenase (quinone)
MVNVAVIHFSLTGTVHRLAETMADACRAAGAEVRLRRVPDLWGGEPVDRPGADDHRIRAADVPEAVLGDLEWADAILLGSPTRFGLPSAEMLRFIDTTVRLSISGALEDKAVSVFTSACATNGGQVTTITALHNAVSHWGSVIVSTGSSEPVLLRPDNGNPYGIGNISRNVPGRVPDDTLAAARFLARRTIRVAHALTSLPRPITTPEKASA